MVARTANKGCVVVIMIMIILNVVVIVVIVVVVVVAVVLGSRQAATFLHSEEVLNDNNFEG